MDIYELEKKIWTEVNFDDMGWHDCRIYKMKLAKDIEFDIDYILQWNKPEIDGLPLTFWVAPATLVFKEVSKLEFNITTAFHEAIEIQDIKLDKNNKKFRWTIATQSGSLEFEAESYTQWIRQEPFFQFGQVIPYIERNGFSLEKTIDQDNPNRFRKDVIEKREKEFEYYEILRKRYIKRKEQVVLEDQRKTGKIDIKTYLIKKRELSKMLDYYDTCLKGTQFEKC